MSHRNDLNSWVGTVYFIIYFTKITERDFKIVEPECHWFLKNDIATVAFSLQLTYTLMVILIIGFGSRGGTDGTPISSNRANPRLTRAKRSRVQDFLL